MSRWKPWGVGVVVLLLSGCATDPAPTRASDDPQRRQLAEAGQRIAQALETLAATGAARADNESGEARYFLPR